MRVYFRPTISSSIYTKILYFSMYAISHVQYVEGYGGQRYGLCGGDHPGADQGYVLQSQVCLKWHTCIHQRQQPVADGGEKCLSNVAGVMHTQRICDP